MATLFVADRTVEGNARNGQPSGFPKIWARGGYVYQLVVQTDWKPIIHRLNRSTGEWDQSADLTSIMGLVDVEDSHDAVTMAVDGQGYVHVVGNMHFERLKYAKSNSPYDLTDGFSAGPYPQGWATVYRNMVKNPDCAEDLTGWSAPADARFSSAVLNSGKTYSIKPGSTGYADNLENNCCRVDRTSSSPDNVIGIVYVGGGTTPGSVSMIEVDAEESIFASVSVAADKNPYRARVSVEFRNSSGGIISTSTGGWYTDLSASATLSSSLRIFCEAGIAPAGTTNVRLVVEAQTTSGNAANNDSIFCDAALVVQGSMPSFLPDNEQAGINIHTKRSFYFSPNYSQYEGIPASEGVRLDPEWWEGIANQSTSITRRMPSGEHYQMSDYSTYQTFGGFSDGGLLWSTNQSKQEVTGTSRTMYRMGPDTGWEWIPIHPATNGVIAYTPTNNVDEDNLDSVPHRYYGYQTWVGPDDSINHIGCFRWEPGNDSMDHQLFIRSFDKGETWVDINNNPVSIPLTWPESINSSYEVLIDGTTPIGGATAGGFVSDSEGRPWFMLNTQTARDGTAWSGRHLITHDGTEWRATDLSTTYPMSDEPALAYLNGDIWVIYAKAGGVLVPKSRHLFVANWTQGSDPELIDLGPVDLGTPDGEYQFESGATYHPAPRHARDSWDDKSLIIPVPNGDDPWFYELGGFGYVDN